MDKYDFSYKVDQIKKLVKLGDYAAAMKIADSIDWRRVSSVSLLSLVSEIYEKNRDYTEAKEILLLAYERAPIGKRLLYKLTMLALSEGNIPEAEAYYREFYDLAPDDPRQHILRYLILKDKGAPAEQLINTLEQYIREELDEHWMYELAELYHQAGQSEACVEMCDKIMLMFGIGNYVDKAIDLKLNREGKALTAYQQSLIDNRDKYESKLKDMDEHPDKYDPDADAIVVEKPENYEVEVEEENNLKPGLSVAFSPEEPQPEEPQPEEPVETDEVVMADVNQILNVSPVKEEEPEMTIYTVNFIVERKSEEDGFAAAVRLLKLMHEHTGSQNKVTKIKAEKLNETGVTASRDKLIGKDLIVEQAGDLSAYTVAEILDLIKAEPEDRVVVLIDNPMQVRKMTSSYPELLKLFHIDKEENSPVAEPKKEEPEVKVASTAAAATVTQAAAQTQVAQAPATPAPAPAQPAPAPAQPAPAPAQSAAPAPTPVESKMTEQMEIDEFADYAQKYAESIDCSISGKSKLALYERIELMEEDGIALTRENAVALIEEAADLAEKPSLGRKLSGMFQPKYDKDDKLILREEHFIN